MNTTKGRINQAPFTGLGITVKGQKFFVIIGAVILLGLPGSLCFASNETSGTEASRTTAETAMDREMAELVKLYRLCLQKNEDNPAKAKESCGMYKEAIREFSPDNLKSIVAELLNGLRNNCEKADNRRDKES
jgi:hypothetical protein